MITLSLKDITSFTKAYFAIQILFPTTMSFAKISMLFLYRRIFPSRRFNILLYVVGAVILAWWFAGTLAIIFVCHPVQYFWDKTIPGGHCGSETGILYGIAGPNVVTDVVVLVLPLPILWKLQMRLLVPSALCTILFTLSLLDMPFLYSGILAKFYFTNSTGLVGHESLRSSRSSCSEACKFIQ